MKGTPTRDGSEQLQELVRTFAEAAFNEPGEVPLPMATDDAREVIKAQLTENTGAHFLDSGGAYGRHWEENQENPPWEDPAYDVQGHSGDGWVTHNVYHYMTEQFGRDRTCVALETALYAYSKAHHDRKTPQLSQMEPFAESLIEGTVHRADLEDIGVPDEFIEDVLGFQHDLSGGVDRSPGYAEKSTGPFTVNTYNGDAMHSLSQVLQSTAFGGPYADYVMVQVHQGADVRGGYTGPRVYTDEYGHAISPMEYEFRCTECGWLEYESCLVRGDGSMLLYQPTIDPAEYIEAMGFDPDEYEEGDCPRLDAALEQAHDDEAVGGAIFHVGESGQHDHCGGYVAFH